METRQREKLNDLFMDKKQNDISNFWPIRFSTNPRDIKRGRLAFGIVFFILGVSDFFSLDPSLSTGLWSGVYRNISAIVGKDGYAIIKIFIGFVYIIVALMSKITSKE
jgi:hypothetical protein